MKHLYQTVLLCLALVCIQPALAQKLCVLELTQQTFSGDLPLEAGAEIKITFQKDGFKTKKQTIEAVYLGRIMGLDGLVSDHAFFDTKSNIIHFVAEEEIEFPDGMNLDKDVRMIAKTLAQRNGTCAAYALFNCAHQLYLGGVKGNGNLEADFTSREGQLQALGQAVEKYYGDETHVDGIEQIASYYGLKHKRLMNHSVEIFKKQILDNVNKEGTVLIRFDVPKSMSKTPYAMIDHADNKELPRKLWQPKKAGEESLGGHMIVITAAFKANGDTYLLVQDANWKTVRLWNLNVLSNLYSAGLAAWRIY